MNTLNLQRTLVAIVSSFIVAGGVVSACSSDSNNEPSSNAEGGSAGESSSRGGKNSKGGEGGDAGASVEESGGNAGEGGKSAVGGKSSTIADTTLPVGGSTGGNTTSSVGGSMGGNTSSSVGGSTVACVPDTTKNCYSCQPTKTEQFLNACKANGERPACNAFDNSKLTKFVNGKLPPLP